MSPEILMIPEAEVVCVTEGSIHTTGSPILEAIFEQDFIDTSYGFRPNRSCHDALTELDRIIMNAPVNFVVDKDISKFFDTVDHKRLMECLKQRIVDPSLLQLIGRFLKSDIIEEGKYFETGRGTPQGGVLSPVLANPLIYSVLRTSATSPDGATSSLGERRHARSSDRRWWI